MTLIALIFNKSRFLNISNQYKFTYSFYCIYGVFSGLLMPNFAMEKAFELQTQNSDPTVKRDIAIYLIDGIYSNFHNLIFSAANYKILQPVIVQRLRKFARKIPKMVKNFRNKKKGETVQVDVPPSDKFDLISEMKRIKEETRKLQEAQEKENDALIFGLSFMTNCFFNVCFYGLLTPSVFFYILPAYCSFIAFDWLKFKLENKMILSKINQTIRKSFKTIQKISLNRSKQFSSSKKPAKKGIQANIKTHSVQEIPWTIYVNFLYMLLLGGFPLSLLGYFGLAKRLSKFLVIHRPLLKSVQSQSMFFHIYDWSFGLVDKLCILIFNESAIMMVETFTKSLKDMIKTTLRTLIEDRYLLLGFVLYLAILVLIIVYFRIERYINRVQSRIWKNTKVLEENIGGDSFRKTNPAYKMLV